VYFTNACFSVFIVVCLLMCQKKKLNFSFGALKNFFLSSSQYSKVWENYFDSHELVFLTCFWPLAYAVTSTTAYWQLEPKFWRFLKFLAIHASCLVMKVCWIASFFKYLMLHFLSLTNTLNFYKISLRWSVLQYVIFISKLFFKFIFFPKK